ncbi:MAG: hypothetical protein WCG80_03180 [Spirochaetales bacterium]
MRKFMIGLVLMLAVFTFVGAIDDGAGPAGATAEAPATLVR